MSDEGGRWRRFFRGPRCFCLGCSSCTRKSYDDERQQKMEESDEEVKSSLHQQEQHLLQHFHQPLIHQPLKQQQQHKQQFLPLLPKEQGTESPPATTHVTNTTQQTKQTPSPSFLPSQSERGQTTASTSAATNWCLLRKSRRCSLEERIPSFVLPQSYISCDLLDVHYLEQAQKLLNNVNKWNFNIFVLDWLTNGRSFYYLVMHLFHEYNFLNAFQLDTVNFLRTLKLVELGYCRKNPYHNSLHAADVVQAIHCNLLEEHIGPHLTPLEKMAAIVAAACHDLDHPGVNQSFLIASSHHLAPLYNGVSVLENHHWRGTVSILRESHLFDHLTSTQWSRLRYLLEILILATDISKQQDILLKFQEYVNSHSFDLAANEEHRNFILQITLKCADICNPCRSWKVSKKWSQLICEEFFRQGDKEKLMKLPVTISFDRQQSSTAKIQTGFMSFVVEPLFIEWDKFAPSQRSKAMLSNLSVNRYKWTEIEQEDSLHETDENQKKLSNSTLVSFLDWEDEDCSGDERGCSSSVVVVPSCGHLQERRISDSSNKPSQSRKTSASSISSRLKSKLSSFGSEKENFYPRDCPRSSRGSEIYSSPTPSKQSISSPPSKTGEKRRLSLPVSKQITPSALSQAINQRRSSLPLARILEVNSTTNSSVVGSTSRGGWSLMTNTSSGQLESLSELSPPLENTGCSSEVNSNRRSSLDAKSKKTNSTKCPRETELNGKKYERLKFKFSFDSQQRPSQGVERSESFSTAPVKKSRNYHHYSEMVLSLCNNLWFDSKGRRRASCPMADVRKLNSIGDCSSNHLFRTTYDDGCCNNYVPSSAADIGSFSLIRQTSKKGTSKRGMHVILTEREKSPSKLKLHNVDSPRVFSGRNRRVASLTDEMQWPKFRTSKKRAKSLVTSSLTDDGSIICQTHLLRNSADLDSSKKSKSSCCSSGDKVVKKSFLIALQCNSKEIFSKLTSAGGGTTPSGNSTRNNSVPQTSCSRLPGPPFKSSPAILRFVDVHVRPQKRPSSILDSVSHDGEVVPLLPKS